VTRARAHERGCCGPVHEHHGPVQDRQGCRSTFTGSTGRECGHGPGQLRQRRAAHSDAGSPPSKPKKKIALVSGTRHRQQHRLGPEVHWRLSPPSPGVHHATGCRLNSMHPNRHGWQRGCNAGEVVFRPPPHTELKPRPSEVPVFTSLIPYDGLCDRLAPASRFWLLLAAERCTAFPLRRPARDMGSRAELSDELYNAVGFKEDELNPVDSRDQCTSYRTWDPRATGGSGRRARAPSVPRPSVLGARCPVTSGA
jgi:hypothetical protein